MTEQAQWTAGGRLAADGKSLDYRCCGPAPGDAPSIVLLHEGLGCAALWRDFPERLSAETGCGVMAYSRAGYGQSDPAPLPRPFDYLTREAVDVLPDVLDAVGFRRGVLMGHSDGATIAVEHAGRVGDPRIAGVVAMAPHFFLEEKALKEIKVAKKAYELTRLRESMAKYHRDPDIAFRGWNEAWLRPEFEAWSVEDALDTLRVPVLAIQGVDDQYGTLAQIDVIAARSPAPVTLLPLENCRHAPQFEQPEKVLEAVAAFCNAL